MKKLKLEELNRLNIEEFLHLKKIPVTIILDDIRSAMNVGAVFRSSDAFAIEKIILCGITAQPPHKEILKTAIGATNSVTWEYISERKEACIKIKAEGYQLIAIEQVDISIPLKSYKIDQNKSYAIVFGNEVNGVHSELLPMMDAAIEIEQYGTKHSLNISVCAGIVLYQFSNAYRKS